MGEPLRIEALAHGYGPVPVLDQIDLAVAPGELVAVLGTSGCGKTTLLRAVAGLVTPRGGRITMDGVVVAEAGRLRVPIEGRRVGIVFQDYALFGSLSVRANVGYGLRGEPGRVAELLERVGLTDCADRLPSELSGGQQQRVALARALAPRPSLLLLDEPFANVDADRRDALATSLRQALRAEGRSAVLVTHDRADALGIADRVLVLVSGPDGGRVGQVGTPEVVYAEPAGLEVARLTGPCCHLRGEASGGVVQTAVGSVAIAGAEGAGTLILRPEAIALRPDPQGAGEVVGTSFRGAEVRIWVETAAGRLLATAPGRLEEGQRVAITLGQPAIFRS